MDNHVNKNKIIVLIILILVKMLANQLRRLEGINVGKMKIQ